MKRSPWPKAEQARSLRNFNGQRLGSKERERDSKREGDGIIYDSIVQIRTV